MRAARSASRSCRWASPSKWMRSSPSEADPLDPGPAGFAHRGLHYGARFPENSLLAFAARAGARRRHRMRPAADGRRPDPGLPRRRCLADVREPAADRPIDAAPSSAGCASARDPIPTLESLLALVDGRVPLLLEVKVDGDIWRWVPALKRALADYRGRHRRDELRPAHVAPAQDQSSEGPSRARR